MPSQALIQWQTARMNRLAALDAQCAACSITNPPDQSLLDENLRAYAVLLSAHFQGFCRDLYTECSQVIASKVRASLRLLLREQFGHQLALDHGNPTHSNIRRDFERFGFKLQLEISDPANPVRLMHLSQLNEWRNVAAHQETRVPVGGPLALASLRTWQRSCGGLAQSLDRVVYNHLRRLLRRQPWTP